MQTPGYRPAFQVVWRSQTHIAHNASGGSQRSGSVKGLATPDYFPSLKVGKGFGLDEMSVVSVD